MIFVIMHLKLKLGFSCSKSIKCEYNTLFLYADDWGTLSRGNQIIMYGI